MDLDPATDLAPGARVALGGRPGAFVDYDGPRRARVRFDDQHGTTTDVDPARLDILEDQ